ncbi:DUF2797 domain-containing protein [Gilvimarinus agarilyticus]|uniref:DUF2797 domain-containing protein n=1 Tax=Gilvimarinus agarilyticus TaxID=679259 RepID=UPI0005A00A95|nr:DUF2797 domain-containing protein [Gilvimarinus agarilyticus]
MADLSVSGALKKMHTRLDSEGKAHYELELGDTRVPLSDLLNHDITLTASGDIYCVLCDRKTKKSFSQGHCYPCFTRSASCDICMVSPEKCHYEQGTCREPEWAQTFCFNDHVVYLANSSDPKVGITRASQIPTRWIDQGASWALPVYRVSTRQLAGLIESHLKPHISDKTRWQAMLKGVPEAIDLSQLANELTALAAPYVDSLTAQYGADAVSLISQEGDAEPVKIISYPVAEYPSKVKSLNLDKQPIVSGRLTGIKGQYLMFGDQVFNVRKFSGYQVQLDISE